MGSARVGSNPAAVGFFFKKINKISFYFLKKKINK
jgi:hypothetical protein